jgi:hypothetical protein
LFVGKSGGALGPVVLEDAHDGSPLVNAIQAALS